MRRRYFEDDETTPDIIPPGCGVRVHLADSVHGRAMTDAMIRASGPHRPGPVMDALALPMSAHDAADLAGKMAERQAAHDAQYERQQWRDGPAVNPRSQSWAAPLPPPDDDNRDDDNGDDLQAAMDRRERARLERDRIGDNKWRAMGGTMPGNTGMSNLQTPPRNGLLDPRKANEIQAQAERWRGGK